MYIALLAFEILVASRGVLGSVIGRDSLIKNLHGRDVQSTVISACRWEAPLNKVYYNVLDPGADICQPAGGDLQTQELKPEQHFEFETYGTRCTFHVEKKWDDVGIDERFGYADCPGLKNIPGLRREGVFHSKNDEWDVRSKWCYASLWPPFVKPVYCYSRIFLTWDGCLSCEVRDEPEKNCAVEKYRSEEWTDKQVDEWTEKNQCKDVCPDEQWGLCPVGYTFGLCQCTAQKCIDSDLYTCWVKP